MSLEIALIQGDNKQIAADIFRVMRMKKTNLSSICRDNDINHQRMRTKLYADSVSAEYLLYVLQLVDPKIVVNFNFNSVTLKMDIEYILS